MQTQKPHNYLAKRQNNRISLRYNLDVETVRQGFWRNWLMC